MIIKQSIQQCLSPPNKNVSHLKFVAFMEKKILFSHKRDAKIVNIFFLNFEYVSSKSHNRYHNIVHDKLTAFMVFNRQNKLHLWGIKEICLSNFDCERADPSPQQQIFPLDIQHYLLKSFSIRSTCHTWSQYPCA